MRLISSHAVQPTSPTKRSLVPGLHRRSGTGCGSRSRRCGARSGPSPWRPGCRAARRPCPGSRAGSRRCRPSGRRRAMSCERSAPPSACRRGQGRPGAPRRVAARVARVAVLAVVGEVEARAVAAADVQRAVGAEDQVADRVARVLLAPALEQHLLDAVGELARAGRSPRSRRPVAPGRGRAASGQRGQVARARVLVVRVERRRRTGARSRTPGRARARAGRGPRSRAPAVRRSAYTVGVVVAHGSRRSRMRPDFSATNTRPSGAKRIAVGLVRPDQATLSLKPGGHRRGRQAGRLRNGAEAEAWGPQAAAAARRGRKRRGQTGEQRDEEIRRRSAE